MHRRVCKPRLAWLAAAALLAPAAGAQEAGVFPLAEVEPGLKGTGRSVFRGGEPESFDVEVLGVWRDVVAPDTSYILARLSGRGLEDSGVVAGMSGSPVYIGDRLVGAVAFSWPMSQEAIAGITPIETMQRLQQAGPAAPPPGRAGTAVDLATLARAEFPPGSLPEALRVLDRQPLAGARGGLLWTGAGFGPQARALLGEALGGGVAAAGRAADLGATLEPGDAVAALLVDGDLQLAAVGTLTARDGSEVLAFGHPFLGIGDLLLPMAKAEVVTVVGSRFVSFKLANTGPAIGAFDLDRAAGLRGRLGLAAPMVPLSVTVRGGREATYDLRVVDVPQLLPALAALGVLGSIDATTQAAGIGTVDLAARLQLAGREPLVLEQSFDGDGAAVQAGIYLMSLANFLVNNGYGEVAIEGIEIEAAQSAERRNLRLLRAHPDRRIVQPGESLGLEIELAPFRGQPFRERLEVRIPEGVPDGPYFVLVGDGASADVARLTVEKAAPESLEQALSLLRTLTSRRRLVALGLRREPGLRVAGETLARLPGSVRSLWQAADAVGAEDLEIAVEPLAATELAVPASGLTRVDLEVWRDPGA